MSPTAQVGDLVSVWARPRDMPGLDGERRHLFFGCVQFFLADIPRFDRTIPMACGIPFGDRFWDIDDSSPKCERCRQIADGDSPSAREDVPAPGEREPVAA